MDDALKRGREANPPARERPDREDLLAEEHAPCLFCANSGSGRQGQVIDFPGCRGAVTEQRAKDLVNIGKDLAAH